MAQYMAQNGMIAFTFDNPETAECAIDIEREGDYGNCTRTRLCFGYIQSGMCYAGISVFQKLCLLRHMKTLPFVDQNRIAVSSHSLGSLPSLFLGLLSDDVKAVIFSDFVCDPIERYVSITEEPEDRMTQNTGNWHKIPGLWKYFSHQNLLAALAPKFLACSEGGAETYLDTIRRGYKAAGVPERLQISYYPKYADPEFRKHGALPLYGLRKEAYFEHCSVDAPDHSFRKEPSIRFLKKCFSL